MTTDLQTHINGRLRGRAVPELPMHTFKDSGITVHLHKLSPITRDEIVAAVRRELKDSEPQPPIVEVDYGNGKVLEPHKGHPVYQEKLKEWESKVNSEALERFFKLACLDAIEVTIGDAERAAIARKKRYMKIAGKFDWQSDPDLTPAENDQVFYIAHIACGSPDDIKELYEAIATRSQPTEAAVEQHKASFPGDVQGSVGLEL